MNAFRTLRVALFAAALVVAGQAQADPVKLTWFMWSGSEPEVTAWKHVASLVTDKYPDITVEFQTTSFPDYWTKLPALAAAGKLPDIISLQSLRAPGFAGLMEPLDDRIKADKFDIGSFEPSILKGLSRDGKQFALPYDFGPLVMFYNHDLFVKEGVKLPKPGWTEADFMAAARALTKNGNYGFAISEPDAFMAALRTVRRVPELPECQGRARTSPTNAGLKQARSRNTRNSSARTKSRRCSRPAAPSPRPSRTAASPPATSPCTSMGPGNLST